MNRRDIVIGLVILLIIAAAIYMVRRPKEIALEIPEETVEEMIEERLRVEIPEDVDKAELRDVMGTTSSGIATRKYETGLFTHEILVDLPDPDGGEFYEGWLVKEGDVVYTGKFRVAKGGYVLEYSNTKDLSDYNEVVVTLEKKDDKLPETHVLEGNF